MFEIKIVLFIGFVVILIYLLVAYIANRRCKKFIHLKAEGDFFLRHREYGSAARYYEKALKIFKTEELFFLNSEACKRGNVIKDALRWIDQYLETLNKDILGRRDLKYARKRQEDLSLRLLVKDYIELIRNRCENERNEFESVDLELQQRYNILTKVSWRGALFLMGEEIYAKPVESSEPMFKIVMMYHKIKNGESYHSLK